MKSPSRKKAAWGGRPEIYSSLIPRTPLIPLSALALILGYAVFNYGGVTMPEWNYCLIASGALSLLLWIPGPASRLAPALDSRFMWALIAVCAWPALQLAPLPLSLLRVLSPARAELTAALIPLGAHLNRAPLSVSPPVTLSHLLRLIAFVVVFLAVRELSWRLGRRRWFAVIPILLIAVLEAALGLAQYFGGGGRARGTYVNPDHYAAFLEMSLPLVIMLTVNRLRSRRPSEGGSLGSAIVVCLLLVCSATVVLGLLYSLSRMGLAAALASCALLIILFISRPASLWKRIASGAAITAAVLLLLFLVTPSSLLDRFSSTPAPGEITREDRLQFWSETCHLIADYSVFGAGLGTYGSAIQKYRTSDPDVLLDFAHNDYLQLVAEVGIVGAIPFIAFIVLFVPPLFRSCVDNGSAGSRMLAIACASSLFAMALHALADFNFYIPANAMLAAWIAGMASALPLSGRRHQGSNRKVTLEPYLA